MRMNSRPRGYNGTQSAFADTNSPTSIARKRPHHLGGRDDLADVALGVLGGVEEEAEDVAGELHAAHLARLQQGALVGGAELRERAVDGGVDEAHQLGSRRRRL